MHIVYPACVCMSIQYMLCIVCEDEQKTLNRHAHKWLLNGQLLSNSKYYTAFIDRKKYLNCEF